MFGIPVPRYALVNREYPYQDVDFFTEEDDFVEVHGERFFKPFVEKPVHGKTVHIVSYVASPPFPFGYLSTDTRAHLCPATCFYFLK